MSDYLYGVYGHLADSVVSAADEAPTTVVYVGTAPVNLVRGYADAGIINTPVRLRNYSKAVAAIGYSSDWESFTLSEAVAAHFANDKGNIGPIYVINVLDPATHVSEDDTTVSLAFTNGRATIVSDTIIIDTLVLDGKAEGTDYTLSYDYANGRLNIISADSSNPITGSVSATYSTVDPSAVTSADIIGEKTELGVYSGMQALELLYQNFDKIPNILVAPGWSSTPAVYQAMITIMTSLNGHWDGMVYADIPLTPTTMSAAVTWKNTNFYTDERSKVFWPMATGADGNVYHLSSLAAVETMRIDASHDGVPYETCGNKTIPVVAQYFGESSTNAGFSQIDSDTLTSNGIATAVYWASAWRLWGDSTAAYVFDDETVDVRDYFDVSMRMLFYLTNGFQTRWSEIINQPMTVQLRDTILVREQEQLDGLVARGALVGSPVIEFIPENNDEDDILHGNFQWDIQATPVIPLKSATAYVAYTDAGLSAYLT